MEESAHLTERDISGPDGEVYQIETSLPSADSISEDPYTLFFSVVTAPAEWDMQRRHNQHPYARPDCRDEDEMEDWRNSGKQAQLVPTIPTDSTRVSVTLDWYRVFNQQSHLRDDRHLTAVQFTIPCRKAVETALRVVYSDDAESVESAITETIDEYQWTHDCSAVEAYSTWLYDASLLVPDETMAECIATLESEYATLSGVTAGVITVSDVRDVGDRVTAIEEDGSSTQTDWLLGDACVRVETGTGSPATPTSPTSGDSTETEEVERRVRDSAFRRRVLSEYGTACVICGADRHSPEGNPEVEAAHVKPKSADGPDTVENGLPLCKVHHWAFDEGWLTISPDYTIHVRDAPNVSGYDEFQEFHGEPLQFRGDAPRPKTEYIQFHRRYTFGLTNGVEILASTAQPQEGPSEIR